MLEVHDKTERLTNIRGIGAIIAADLKLTETEKNQRIGYQIFQKALQLGAWLRPLGDTLYWLPPLNTPLLALEELKDISILAIKQILTN